MPTLQTVINVPHSTKMMAIDVYGERLRNLFVFFCARQNRTHIGIATHRFTAAMNAHSSRFAAVKCVWTTDVVAQMRIDMTLAPGAVLTMRVYKCDEITHKFVRSRRRTEDV